MKTIKYNIYNYQNSSSEEAYKTNSNSTGSGGSGGGGGGTIIDNTAINLLNDWFYMSNGVLHCRYPFAGDSEISAYQTADSSTTLQTIKTALNGITASSTTAEIGSALESIKQVL